MIKKLLLALLCPLLATVASCTTGGKNEAIDDLREAEAAIALGNMEAARSVASKVIGDENLNKLSATELARLSLVYMQIADSTERESSIAQATDLYRKAFDVNADSAATYYSDVTPEMYPYVTMLKTLVGHLDNPYNPEADSVDESMNDMLPDISDSLRQIH